MKITSPDTESDSGQEIKTSKQLPDAPTELLFLMDHEEKFPDKVNIEI